MRMKEKLFLLLVGVTAIMYAAYMTNKELPKIMLPKAMQHNTIGELPIVEMADDGVFSEIDGTEHRDRGKRWEEMCYASVSKACNYYDNKTRREVRKGQERFRKCYEKSINRDGTARYDVAGFSLSISCGENPPVFDTKEKCLKRVKDVCTGGVPSCSSLNVFGYGCFTCWGDFI